MIKNYSVKYGNHPLKFFEKKEKMIKWICKKFGEQAALDVREWKDDFEGRELGETYVSKDENFAIVSVL